MYNKIKRLILLTVAIGGSFVPQGRFKEYIKHYLYWYQNPLYSLDSEIESIKVQPDGIIAVVLKDGTQFYGNQDAIRKPWIIKYADKRRLTKIAGFDESALSFFNMLMRLYLAKSTDYEHDYVLKSGDVVVDLGANIGVFTVKAAKAVGPRGKVIAIESEDSALALLRENIEANKLENVIVVPKRIWSSKGKLKLQLSKTTQSHSFCQGDDRGEITDQFITVDVDTLDSVMNELNIEKVDFVKMNIEGAETEALVGMEKMLASSNCKLAIVTHVINGKYTYRPAVAHLKEKGFKVKVIGRLTPPFIPNLYARKVR